MTGNFEACFWGQNVNVFIIFLFVLLPTLKHKRKVATSAALCQIKVTDPNTEIVII